MAQNEITLKQLVSLIVPFCERPLCFWSTRLAGEMGELCSIIASIEAKGNRSTVAKFTSKTIDSLQILTEDEITCKLNNLIGKEIADNIICLFLIAYQFPKLNLVETIAQKLDIVKERENDRLLKVAQNNKKVNCFKIDEFNDLVIKDRIDGPVIDEWEPVEINSSHVAYEDDSFSLRVFNSRKFNELNNDLETTFNEFLNNGSNVQQNDNLETTVQHCNKLLEKHNLFIKKCIICGNYSQVSFIEVNKDDSCTNCNNS